MKATIDVKNTGDDRAISGGREGITFLSNISIIEISVFCIKKKTAHIIQSCFSVYQIVAELVVQETKDDD